MVHVQQVFKMLKFFLTSGSLILAYHSSATTGGFREKSLSKSGGRDRQLLRIKMAVFWVVAPCSLVEVYQHFRGAYRLMMEAASASETSVNFYQTRWATNQKTAIFILAAVRTSNLTQNQSCRGTCSNNRGLQRRSASATSNYKFKFTFQRFYKKIKTQAGELARVLQNINAQLDMSALMA
jgi:hypothetical protein